MSCTKAGSFLAGPAFVLPRTEEKRVGDMKVRWNAIAGMVHGQRVEPGRVTEVPDEDGARYCALGYCTPVAKESDEDVEKRDEGPLTKSDVLPGAKSPVDPDGESKEPEVEKPKADEKPKAEKLKDKSEKSAAKPSE